MKFATIGLFSAIGLIPLVLNAENAVRFGPFEGELSWDSANTRCTSKGMRLPTRMELLDEFKSGGSKAWDKYPYSYYWSSTAGIPGTFYYVHMDVGFSGISSPADNAYARCVEK